MRSLNRSFLYSLRSVSCQLIAKSILTISHDRVERKCSRSPLAPMFLKTTVPKDWIVVVDVKGSITPEPHDPYWTMSESDGRNSLALKQSVGSMTPTCVHPFLGPRHLHKFRSSPCSLTARQSPSSASSQRNVVEMIPLRCYTNPIVSDSRRQSNPYRESSSVPTQSLSTRHKHGFVVKCYTGGP